MTKTNFDFMSEVETITASLSGVVDALSIFQEQLDADLHFHQSHVKGMDYCLRISSAMVPSLLELDRIRAELDAATEAAYAQKKEGRP